MSNYNFNITAFYRVFGVLTMGNFLLPIVFENIFFPISSTLFYLFGWITSLLVFYPRIFLLRSFFPIYFFIGIYFLFFKFVVFDTEALRHDYTIFEWLRRELQPIVFALLIFNCFLFSKDFKGLRIILLFSLFFIIITIITTIAGLQQYPLAAREMGGALQARGDSGLIDYYRSIGISGYGFFYGLAFAVPVFVSFLKLEGIENKKKVGFLFITLLAIVGILVGQFTTALLFAIMGGALAFWTKERIKPAITRLIVFLVIIIIFPRELLAGSILYIAELVGEGTLQNRLTDLSTTVSAGFGVEGTHVDLRYARIPFLIDSFFSSPFIGGGVSLGHNWWLDRLSMFGLAGVIPWIIIIRSQIIRNLKMIHGRYSVYYLLTMILFIGMGVMKNMVASGIWLFVFFIIPALLILNKGIFNLDKMERDADDKDYIKKELNY